MNSMTAQQQDFDNNFGNMNNDLGDDFDENTSYITELNPNDVLFGRGSGPNDHEGNIKFRQLVADRKAEYLATNHRQTKAKIAREIVGTVYADNGRFLKKVEHFEARRLGIPKGVDAWTTVDDDTVMEKAKQALRQNTAKAKGECDRPSITSSSGVGKSGCNDDLAARVGNDVEPRPIGVSSGGFGGGGIEAAQFRHSANADQILPTSLVATANLASANGSAHGKSMMAPPSAIDTSRGEKKDQFLSHRNPMNEGQYFADTAPKPTIIQAGKAPSSTDMSFGDISFGMSGRLNSTDMQDLESSFSRLKAREEHVAGPGHLQGRRSSQQGGRHGSMGEMFASVETMGTIESIDGPLPDAPDREDNMSYASFNSSTFSVFKSMNEDTDGPSANIPGEMMPSANAVSRESKRAALLDAANNRSTSISDVWGANPGSNRRGSLLERLMAEERAEALADAQALTQEPRRFGLLEDEPDSLTNLGLSSMSVMNSVFDSTNSMLNIHGNHNDQGRHSGGGRGGH